MARTATTADAFNAIAEVRRRDILDLLAEGERTVSELTRLLGMAQPQVSKHLRVLREVGVVSVQESGRLRVYRLNGPALKPIHDWVSSYAHLWEERFASLDGVLESLQGAESEAGAGSDAGAGVGSGAAGAAAVTGGGRGDGDVQGHGEGDTAQ